MFRKLESKLRRTAREIKNYRIARQVIKMVCICLALILCIIYLLSLFYYNAGKFQITIKKSDNTKMSLALSEYQYSDNATSSLSFNSARRITNISTNMIPRNVNDIDGEHNGKNYSAFTFYVRNVDMNPVSFQYSLYINQCSNQIDEAIRIRLYVEDEYTDYARVSSDGITPEKNTTAFQTQSIIVTDELTMSNVQQTTKFTIVMWLEGDDP